MSYFLALDAGGTKTDYLLADEQRVLARVRSGSIKRMRVDAQTAAHHLDTALEELRATAGVPMNAITRTCIGTAGESVPLVADWLCEAFAQRVAGELILVGDVEIALDAAFPGMPGVLVLAGTGSNVAGRGNDGKISTTGGWRPGLRTPHWPGSLAGALPGPGRRPLHAAVRCRLAVLEAALHR
jgi:N-acetylglucosamine kinase-like BadF-type ATPase